MIVVVPGIDVVDDIEPCCCCCCCCCCWRCWRIDASPPTAYFRLQHALAAHFCSVACQEKMAMTENEKQRFFHRAQQHLTSAQKRCSLSLSLGFLVLAAAAQGLPRTPPTWPSRPTTRCETHSSRQFRCESPIRALPFQSNPTTAASTRRAPSPSVPNDGGSFIDTGRTKPELKTGTSFIGPSCSLAVPNFHNVGESWRQNARHTRIASQTTPPGSAPKTTCPSLDRRQPTCTLTPSLQYRRFLRRFHHHHPTSTFLQETGENCCSCALG